ncbi:hypothetical protein [Saccharothrix obliqua]|uniref:hypothetical protein n=1 Tax=Saccharothrix obliqua TaxID=2861747 RepID=UPI001C5E5CA1|nr:hypothetical protein [Saccharothrix obliqua]MBW4716936.1 hypothetical protein [Saccharothrix obliqua]
MSSTPIYDELAATYLVDAEQTGRARPEAAAPRQDPAPAPADTRTDDRANA